VPKGSSRFLDRSAADGMFLPFAQSTDHFWQ
jgi:hypothetical protein